MLKNINESNSNAIKTIPSILQVLVIFLSFVVIIFQFASYTYDMQWFNYWGIDKSFYMQNSMIIVNNLVYSICVFLILVFFAIEVYKNLNDKRCKVSNWLKIIFAYILSCIILSPTIFYSENFNINNLISNVFGIIVSFGLMILYIKKTTKFVNKFKEANYVFMLYKEFFQTLLITFIAIFVSTIILGNINANFTRDYKISTNYDNEYITILYSTNDYYVVANCEIKDNNLIIYKDTQRKIENYDVIYEWRKFDKIIKK